VVAQIKIYGAKAHLDRAKGALSDAIHACAAEALRLPADKRFHRFFPMDTENFYYPEGRTEQYTIIEVSMFEGRSIETKKQFIRMLFDTLHRNLHISPQDIEITIFETPRHNWGIRGAPGDELALDYRVDI
jgi:phenylpyruvate tautomerase PptA (4-oxalocrotonate tautomerase family)